MQWIVLVVAEQQRWRSYVGPFQSLVSAAEYAQRLREGGFGIMVEELIPPQGDPLTE